MFSKSRKDTLVEQAQGLAQDLSEAITPHVERARDELAPRLADARDTIAPKLADARDTIAPKLADARDTVAPHVENARDRFVKDIVPAVQAVLEDARDQAAPVAEEARRRSSLAAAALKGEPVKQKSGKGKYLFLAALAGVGAFVAKKMTGSNESANWQSSYTPTPAPPAPPAPPSPAAPMAGSHVADVPAGGADTALEGDAAGAAPGESLADAIDEPHPVTTPESPAETIDVSTKDDPRP